MARYEYEIDRDVSWNGKKINKGSKIEIITDWILKPTISQIKKAIAEKFGKEFEKYDVFFKKK